MEYPCFLRFANVFFLSCFWVYFFAMNNSTNSYSTLTFFNYTAQRFPCVKCKYILTRFYFFNLYSPF
uniref:Uncharacterized protein n=1 Tax=Yersinia enterocolitica TaxID=630 RepID=B0RKJ7_YEREN|nr:hypothetical protein [Yersinia enterocolitica]